MHAIRLFLVKILNAQHNIQNRKAYRSYINDIAFSVNEYVK